MSREALAATVKLPREAHAVALARRAVAERAGALSTEEIETARLLVSELVTNAVRHGHGDIVLAIEVEDGRARFEVCDEGSGRPHMREHPSASGGFGLNLVDTLSSSWGIDADRARVWFELARAPSGAPEPPPAPARRARSERAAAIERRELITAGALEGARSALAPRRWSAWAAIGVALSVALAALDVGLGEIAILTALLVLPPLLCALLGHWADTALVALVAVGLAALSGVWSEGGVNAYVVALFLVAGGSLLAVVIALLRAAAEVNFRRLRLLRAVADVGNEATGLDDAVARLLDTLVPVFANLCVLDTAHDGAQHALGARASAPDAERVEQAVLGRTPSGPQAPAGSRRAMAKETSQLVTRFDEDLLRGLSHGEEDLETLRSIGLCSAIFVPLRARGQTIGSLAVALRRTRRTYSREDLAFAEVFAGRAAVVLDNAGLTSELSAAERQLDAVLDGLAEAVTVTNAEGDTVYANHAAVELLRLESPRELYDASPGETMSRFAVYDEEGRPVALEQLPGHRTRMGEANPDPLLVRNVTKETGEERWLLNKTSTIADDDGKLLRVVNVIEDVTEAKQAELAQRLLAEAGEALASSLDYEETLQRVAEIAVPRLADWCGVDLPGRRHVQSVAVAHVDPEKVALARRLRERYPVPLEEPTGIPEVIRGGPSQVVGEIPDEALVAYARDEEHLEMLRAVGLGSLIIVPLRAGGQTLGALTLARSDPIRTFGAADLALAEELGRRAGTAVLNARLYTERSAIAQTLQRGLRPPELREIPGFTAASLYRAAGELNEVGGDFYDAFPTERGWMVVVGDVAGQGAEAATLTGLARYTLRSVGQLTEDPAQAVRRLNATLRDQPEMSLCTAICAYLDTASANGSAAMTLANCGHPCPVLIRDGEVTELGCPGTMAGAFDVDEWDAETVVLRAGDTLLMYTDGVLDTVGEGSRFGTERLFETLSAAPSTEPRAVIDHLSAALEAFQHGPQRDDTAVVALHFRGMDGAGG